jgi:hypothetical protein
MLLGMENTTQELRRIKSRLEGTIRSSQSELDVINKAIELVEREQGTSPKAFLLGTGENRDFAKLGLTEAIRKCVGSEFVIPSEVRDTMLMGGFPVPKAGKGRLLNYVFVTLKRLAKTGELDAGKKGGKFAVRRVPKTQSPVPQLSSAALN